MFALASGIEYNHHWAEWFYSEPSPVRRASLRKEGIWPTCLLVQREMRTVWVLNTLAILCLWFHVTDTPLISSLSSRVYEI